MTEEIDSGILINPQCAGITISFTLIFEWSGYIRFEMAAFDNAPETRLFLSNVFRSMAESLAEPPC